MRRTHKEANHPPRPDNRPADRVGGAYRLNNFFPLENVDLSRTTFGTRCGSFSRASKSA